MGTWSINHFDNDLVTDWLYEFNEKPTSEALSRIFNTVIVNEGFIEVDEGARVLAAGEIVAAVRGKKSNDYPEDMPEFRNLQVDDKLISYALHAIDIVTQSDESELRQLWKETDEFDNWLGVVYDLKGRLK